MANQPLRAVVIGAGWAGEGHTRALQACGIEVVAICAPVSYTHLTLPTNREV